MDDEVDVTVIFPVTQLINVVSNDSPMGDVCMNGTIGDNYTTDNEPPVLLPSQLVLEEMSTSVQSREGGFCIWDGNTENITYASPPGRPADPPFVDQCRYSACDCATGQFCGEALVYITVDPSLAVSLKHLVSIFSHFASSLARFFCYSLESS